MWVAEHNAGCELWLVGPDEESLVSRLGIHEGQAHAPIRYFGPARLPETYMMAADVLVLPSYREGFGSVVIEAAACGVPTIAYQIVGVEDAIIEGQTGWLVEEGDIGKLGVTMEVCVTNRKMLNEIGSAARQRVIDRFSSEEITAAWVAFYESELTSKT